MVEETTAELLKRRQELTDALADAPYDLILYLERAIVHFDLVYPDLAAGDAYRALLLTDEIRDENFEYHEEALKACQAYTINPCPGVLDHGSLIQDLGPVTNDGGEQAHNWLAKLASVRCFQILSSSLLRCGCLQSAMKFCERGLGVVPHNKELLQIKKDIEQAARKRLKLQPGDLVEVNNLPDRGIARREVYPWNTYEPDRFSEQSLSFLNQELAKFAPKCEVRVSELPVLLNGGSGAAANGTEAILTCKQLGIFAKEDIAPGEIVLDEYSVLTANNRHKESTCDSCGTELPPLAENSKAVSCPECYDTIFCDDFCYEQAQTQYHPAVCDKDVDSIAKDPDPQDIDQSLYLLLLARLLAMAEHQGLHPLEVSSVKYIWGDFVSPAQNSSSNPSQAIYPPSQWTLPFSFRYNIATPLHILEKMDINIYTTLSRHDIWVFNTAYAKFRGTASARKNPRDGRPDVAAVHPFWCLANHDCDPNVTWEWGGRMVLWARKTRVVGGKEGGIKKGEEVLNHYCDVDLPVQQRREWASGSLGGWCMCRRCREEAAEQATKKAESEKK